MNRTINRQLDASLRMLAFQRAYPQRLAQHALLKSLDQYMAAYSLVIMAGKDENEAIAMVDDSVYGRNLMARAIDLSS